MSRPLTRLGVPMLLALASTSVFAQQPPPAALRPAAQPTTMPAQPAVPANPAQHAQSTGSIPSTGPAPQMRPAPPAPVNAPVAPRTTPAQVRDAQGRIVPGALETVPGRARDPVTGQEFQSTPTPRP